jgi:hypothetical protein
LPDEMRQRLPDELVDELLAGARTEEEIVGPGGLLSRLTKRLVERAMEVELTGHLGYERHQEPPARHGQRPQRHRAEDASDRARPGRGQDSTGSPGQLRAQASASASGALRALTRRSWRSIAAGSERAISRRIWPTSMA